MRLVKKKHSATDSRVLCFCLLKSGQCEFLEEAQRQGFEASVLLFLFKADQRGDLGEYISC